MYLPAFLRQWTGRLVLLQAASVMEWSENPEKGTNTNVYNIVTQFVTVTEWSVDIFIKILL